MLRLLSSSVTECKRVQLFQTFTFCCLRKGLGSSVCRDAYITFRDSCRMKGIGSRWILLPSPMAVRDTFISCLNCKSLKPKTKSSEIMEYTTNNTWFPLRTRLETRVPITDCKERTLGATASSCRVPGPSPFRAVAAVKSEWDCIQLISGSEGENSVLFTMNMTLLSLHKDEARELMEKF